MANLKSPEEVAEIRRLLSEGLSMREVARTLGIQENTVLRYHPKNTVALAADAKRPKLRGPYRKKKKPPKSAKVRSSYFLSPEQLGRIRQMNAQGATARQIADAVGCSESTVFRFKRHDRNV